MNYAKMGYLKAEEAVNLANKLICERKENNFSVFKDQGSGIYKINSLSNSKAAILLKAENFKNGSAISVYLNGKTIKKEIAERDYSEKTLFFTVFFEEGENTFYIDAANSPFECLVIGNDFSEAVNSCKLLSVYNSEITAWGMLYGGKLTVLGDIELTQEGVIDFALAVSSDQLFVFIVNQNNELYYIASGEKILLKQGVNKVGAVYGNGEIYLAYKKGDSIYISRLINYNLCGEESMNLPKKTIIDIRGCANYHAFLFHSQSGANYLKILKESNESNGVLNYNITSSFLVSY